MHSIQSISHSQVSTLAFDLSMNEMKHREMIKQKWGCCSSSCVHFSLIKVIVRWDQNWRNGKESKKEVEVVVYGKHCLERTARSVKFVICHWCNKFSRTKIDCRWKWAAWSWPRWLLDNFPISVNLSIVMRKAHQHIRVSSHALDAKGGLTCISRRQSRRSVLS